MTFVEILKGWNGIKEQLDKVKDYKEYDDIFDQCEELFINCSNINNCFDECPIKCRSDLWDWLEDALSEGAKGYGDHEIIILHLTELIKRFEEVN